LLAVTFLLLIGLIIWMAMSFLGEDNGPPARPTPAESQTPEHTSIELGHQQEKESSSRSSIESGAEEGEGDSILGISTGMTMREVDLALGVSGTRHIEVTQDDGSTLSIYRWALSDGSVMQVRFLDGKLSGWWTVE
jgi:hypothetical protein